MAELTRSTPQTWTDAIGMAMASANSGRTGAGMPKLTNQQASGLIMFARDVMAYAASQGRPVAYDWYGYALPALGWAKRGDRFDTTAGHQQAIYPTSNELWTALQEIATQLDSAAIPFKLTSSPIGSASTYDALAKAAWVDMQANHPLDAEASKQTKATKTPAGATPSPTKLPDTITDENGVVWSITKQGANAVEANVVSPRPPYSPSLSRTGANAKALILDAIKKYAADMKANGYVQSPSGDLDAGDVHGHRGDPTPTSEGPGGAMVLAGLVLLAYALDN